MRRVLLTLLASLSLAAPASAAQPLLVGAADPTPLGQPALAAEKAREVGLTGFRVSVIWPAHATRLDDGTRASLLRATQELPGVRIVAAVYNESSATPVTPELRSAYCSFVVDLVTTVPGINDVVVWNEPNKAHFWKPQFAPDLTSAAPLAYFQLLSECYDRLHAARPGVNVIAAATATRGNDRPEARSNVSHSPGAFLRAIGLAYRASGRTARLFDTVAHHAYPEVSGERPWKDHDSTTISFGDWFDLMQALHDAFVGTAQPIPGQQGVQIWFTETGYQTVPDASVAHLYSGVESDPAPLVDEDGVVEAGHPDAASVAPDQATQLADTIRLAACLPYVGGVFNFGLADEPSLARWQAGLYWPDWTPKDSLPAVAAAVAEANAGTVDCASLKGGPVPTAFTPLPGVVVLDRRWQESAAFTTAHRSWWFAVKPAEDVTVAAHIVDETRGGSRIAVKLRRRAVSKLTVSSTIERGRFPTVTLPEIALPRGRYRMVVSLTAVANPARKASLSGRAFDVVGPVTKGGTTVPPRPKKPQRLKPPKKKPGKVKPGKRGTPKAKGGAARRP